MKRTNIVAVIGIILSIEGVHAEEVAPSGDTIWRCNTEGIAFTSGPGPASVALVWASAWHAEINFDSDNRCPSYRHSGFSHSNSKYYGMENIVISEGVYQF
jgi:hypothetical protein